MRRILVTGMSGTGKSTLLAELARRGFETVDTDEGEWTRWSDEEDGYVWVEERVAELLARDRDTTLYLSGTVSNQGRFYPAFDAVVLLSAPGDVLLRRIEMRTSNNYGKGAAERELIQQHLAEVEPRLRDTCTHELDATRPVDEIVDELVRIGQGRGRESDGLRQWRPDRGRGTAAAGLHLTKEPVPVDLSGVSATLLSNLARRAAAARARRPLLDDSLAVEAVERLDYDFADVSDRGVSWHALRVATFDGAVRRFLERNPAGTVVALGEGLETQFWRVDNGRMRWLTVDLPPVLDLRRRVLPEEPRLQFHSGSVLDLGWVDELEPGASVLVTAQGLLPYFECERVHALIAAMAERLPGSSFVFDVVPEKMLELVRKTSGRERDQAVELWTWLFSRDECAALAEIPGVARLRDLSPPFAFGVAPLVLRGVRCLPRRLRYALPVLPVLEVVFAEPEERT